MKLLFVASECAPFVKTGGLADVIGAVPKALKAHGADVRVLLPAYPALSDLLKSSDEVVSFKRFFGGSAKVVSATAQGIDLLLLDAPHLFDRPGNIYLDDSGKDWSDNHLRFAGLSHAGAQIAKKGIDGWLPDAVSAHDWQAGLVPAYLKQMGGARPPVVMTIHNIAFQGLFDADVREEIGLKPAMFTPERAEYFGKLGFLKAGLALADKITTVSPTYAGEILTPEFGMGLDGLLRARQADLTGILNGIELDVWNPETDENLVSTYSSRSLKRKANNRAEIIRRFGLDKDGDGPLFCVVSRLTEQKGIDLLLQCLPTIAGQGAKLALLGSGHKPFESAFADAANQFRGKIGVIIGYDEALSHLLQGGSDAILVPSRFEPCGLTQLYGLRYGTLPVVARTGGLADTVIHANQAALAAGCATGIQFAPVTAGALEQAIIQTCALYRQPKIWAAMVRRAMRQPFGWDGSAEAYLDLFSELAKQSSEPE